MIKFPTKKRLSRKKIPAEALNNDKKTHNKRFKVRKTLAESLILLILLYILARIIDHHNPPDLSRYHDLSPHHTDRHGNTLRIQLTRDQQYRLPAHAYPRHYRDMLIAYEDRRYLTHPGIDPLAIARAAWQNISRQRTISGASTLTMQTARLLEPRPRTLRSKLIEAFRAWQLERRYSKDDILAIYATLAPMGGNRQGIDTAARHYFGKPASALSVAESAWLIALPQSPNRHNHPDKAKAAAARVLAVAHQRGVLDEHDYRLALQDNVRPAAHPFPQLARHYLDRHPHNPATLDARLQRAFETTLHDALRHQPANVTLAALLLDNDSGAPLAYIGNADYFSRARHGAVDILGAVRSPGSTLKPFVYLAAFSRFHYRPDTLIDDTPISASPWQPANYDKRYLGRITLADALRQSRNIPAVRLLMEQDPGEFAAHLARHGLPLHFPRHGKPTLALILGGTGIRATELAQLYRELSLCTWTQTTPTLASKSACEQTTRILKNVANLRFGAEQVALKTGTSYGWRDQWLIGYTRRYTLLLWRGRADGGFADERDSRDLLPLYQDLLALLPDPPQHDTRIAPLPPRPRPLAIRQSAAPEHLAILTPAHNSTLELKAGQSLTIEAQRGIPPYQWFINERHHAASPVPRITFTPQSAGQYRIRLIDAHGDSTTSRFRIAPPATPAPPVRLQADQPPDTATRQ